MIGGVSFLFFIVLNWHNCVWTAWIVQNVRKSQNVFKLNFKFNFSQSADRCCTVRPGGSLSISPPVGMCRSRGLFLGLISVQGVPKIHKNFKISVQGVWNFHILVNLGLQNVFQAFKNSWKLGQFWVEFPVFAWYASLTPTLRWKFPYKGWSKLAFFFRILGRD